MEKHLFVISLDALGALDLKDTTDLPVLRELIKTGTHIQEVETIYPSLTYPAHTSIITQLMGLLITQKFNLKKILLIGIGIKKPFKYQHFMI